MQKKLLEREQALYASVLGHWKNSADLAAGGLSIEFSENTTDFDTPVTQDSDFVLKKPTLSAARRTRKRRRRLDGDSKELL